MNIITRRTQVEDDERWEYWRSKIPAIIFPSHWQVRVVPPWNGVIARFWVDPIGVVPNPEGPIVCVYLDANNRLGCYGDGSGFNPYWEATSRNTKDGNPFRCGMHETDKLIDDIDKTLKIVLKEIGESLEKDGKISIKDKQYARIGTRLIQIQPEVLVFGQEDTPDTLDQIYINEEICENVEIDGKCFYTTKGDRDQGGKYIEVVCPLLESLGVTTRAFRFVKTENLCMPKIIHMDDNTDSDKVKSVLEEAGAERTLEGWVIKGDLYLNNLGLTKLPLIKEVGGYFDCSNNQLTSLKGAPDKVGGNFYCGNNQLTSLKGCPQEVGGGFYCSYNQLTTLEGAPQSVGGDFDCNSNQLISLKGCPQSVGGHFDCSGNKLTILEGAPQFVDGSFWCNSNQLISLKGAPQSVGGGFYCSYNQLTTLEGAPQKVGGSFYCSYNQLTSLNGCPQEVGGNFYCGNNQLTSLKGCPQEVGGYFNCENNPLISLDGIGKVDGDIYSDFD